MFSFEGKALKQREKIKNFHNFILIFKLMELLRI